MLPCCPHEGKSKNTKDNERIGTTKTKKKDIKLEGKGRGGNKSISYGVFSLRGGVNQQNDRENVV